MSGGFGDWYILDGHTPVLPANPEEGRRWFHEESRCVEKSFVLGTRVSTVFLCLDHSFGDGPPVLFETMVFGGWYDQHQERYCTWDQAVIGHKKILRKVRLMMFIPVKARLFVDAYWSFKYWLLMVRRGLRTKVVKLQGFSTWWKKRW